MRAYAAAPAATRPLISSDTVARLLSRAAAGLGAFKRVPESTRWSARQVGPFTVMLDLWTLTLYKTSSGRVYVSHVINENGEASEADEWITYGPAPMDILTEGQCAALFRRLEQLS